MDASAKLLLLKQDLQKPAGSTADDSLLIVDLEAAAGFLADEGLTLKDDDIVSDMIQVQYAAYLFRKRAASDTVMPTFLRYEINCRKLGQRGVSNE